MTATVPPPLHAQNPAAAKRGGSFFERSLEWFWLVETLRNVTLTLPLQSEGAKRLAARARSRAAIARHVLNLEMRTEDQAQASANELLRNAAYAALVALSPRANPSDEASYSKAIWDSLEELLPQLDYGRSLSPALISSLHQGSVLYFAELPTQEQVAIGSELNQLVDALIDRVELPERGVMAIYLRRVWHAVLLLTFLSAVAFGGWWLYLWRPDLAAGRPWRASSTLGGSGCTSPAQECEQSLGLFFHTTEELNPWLEIDLGVTRSISKVELENRSDCCAERAQPIAVEVSTDHDHWLTVARREEEFSTWKAQFAPVNARWVRMRVLKQTFFHLKRVRIY
jgi:F5/8 type C domain